MVTNTACVGWLLKKFFCKACGKRYKWKGDLSRHQRYECGKEPQFACPHCPHRSRHKQDLKTHVAFKHSNFSKSAEMSSNESRQHVCVKCGKRYKHAKHLTRHLRYECDTEPQFLCPLCPYRSKHKQHLQTHTTNKHSQTRFLF
ncbi:hypothetical protein J6590_014784 [Homalodisca vitripennis]|nr:hypothetical protein J6590_014784 [Homalodisca vitripennis]